MSSAEAPTVIQPAPADERRRFRRRLVAGGAALLLVAAVVLLATDPFAGSGNAPSSFDNTAPTGTTRVKQASLSSQTQVDATLGYADPGTIDEPAGTSPDALQQAQQAAATAGSTLSGARAGLAADLRTLTIARATLAADRRKRSVDCAGTNAASAGATSVCAADVQGVAADDQSVTADAAKVDADRRTLATAQTAAAAAQASLASARSSAAAHGQTSSYTALPAVGAIVRRGGQLYAVDGAPVLLLYGRATAWRAFAAGMSPGDDVAELNRNLSALGDGRGLAGDAFTAATAAAIRSLQAAHGLAQTGTLPLGAVVFAPGAVRVTSVTPTPGAAVQPGPVLGITSTRRVVTIALDAGQQTQVKVGDPVTITLPDNSTTPGRVSYVGTVATAPASGQGGGGGSSSPTIEVDVTPTDPAATGHLDQAPVSVAITTASVRNALVVPVGALLALAGGGYALEEVAADGSHHLVAVELGLFDDAQGLVQVTGSGVAAGQKIVVPAE